MNSKDFAELLAVIADSRAEVARWPEWMRNAAAADAAALARDQAAMCRFADIEVRDGSTC